MKPLRIRMDQVSRQTKVPLPVLERDYIISWVLAGIGDVAPLRKNLAFKGGTALKKCYFGDYRFSEDLDFSALPELPRSAQLETLITQACESGKNKAQEFAPIDLVCERYEEREPHPAGQEAFKIRGKLPWNREHSVPVLVEITVDEPILDTSWELPIIHGYEEPLSAKIFCYSLHEIVLEKMRGILQYKARLEGKRGWAKSRARDYYDLWRILNDYPEHVDVARLFKSFPKKCEVRNVAFSDPGEFFEKIILDHARENWEKSLSRLVAGRLPPFDQVAADLQAKLRKIFGQ